MGFTRALTARAVAARQTLLEIANLGLAWPELGGGPSSPVRSGAARCVAACCACANAAYSATYISANGAVIASLIAEFVATAKRIHGLNEY